MNNSISALVAQFPVTLDIQHNLDMILSILSQAEPDTLVILPEGALSGYAEDTNFLTEIDQQLLAIALQKLQKAAVQFQIQIFFFNSMACLFHFRAKYLSKFIFSKCKSAN